MKPRLLSFFPSGTIYAVVVGCMLVSCDQFSGVQYSDDKISDLEEEIVATVNGANISLKDFQREVSIFKSGFPHSQKFSEADNVYIKKRIVDKLIDKVLIRQYAENKGIVVSPEELAVSLQASTEQHSNDDMKRWLDVRKITSQEWQTKFKDLLLLDKLLDTELKKDLPVITNQDINEYYRERKDEYVFPLRHEIMHLQVQSIALAQTLHAILQKDPSKFSEMANKHSISPDQVTEGNIGLIEKGIMPAPLDQAIFKLHPQNRLSPLITTPFGYHLVYLKRVHPPQAITLQEATESIRSKIQQQQLEQAFFNRLQQLRETSTITVQEEVLLSDKGF